MGEAFIVLALVLVAFVLDNGLANIAKAVWRQKEPRDE